MWYIDALKLHDYEPSGYIPGTYDILFAEFYANILWSDHD